MTKKYQPGDRCQVVTAHGQWLDATIISTREGHGGALVRVDGWVTDVWAKPSEIRLILRVIPEPDPHSTAYQGEVGDHQPRTTETVAKYGHVAKDDEVREVNVELIAEIPTLGKLTGETIGNSNPWERLREMADELTTPKTTTTAAAAVAATLQLSEALTRLGTVTNSTREKIGHIEAAADFAMMGITPEQLRDYISAFAHTIVTGATPEEVERFASQTLRDKWTKPDESLHHITREYRGAK